MEALENIRCWSPNLLKSNTGKVQYFSNMKHLKLNIDNVCLMAYYLILYFEQKIPLQSTWMIDLNSGIKLDHNIIEKEIFAICVKLVPFFSIKTTM